VRAEAALAERRHEVREAARDWKGAGAIDEAMLTTIEAAYPDDRSRLGPVFRVLVFGFTIVALTAVLGLLWLPASGSEEAGAVLLILFGAALVGATEVQIGTFRRRQGGTESATAFLAVSFLWGGVFWLAEIGSRGAGVGDDARIDGALLLLAALCGAAAYRWGYSVFALVATVGVFLLLARVPYGRGLWVAVSVFAAPPLLRASDSGRLPPAHRRTCEAAAVLSLVFLYVAVHLGSWDLGLVEMVSGHSSRSVGSSSAPARPLFAVATALAPVWVLAWGVAVRRRSLINLGFVGVVASTATLRAYVHLAPLWTALLVGGGTAIGVALALRRTLDSGPGRERRGLTAEPLFANPERRNALEVAVGLAGSSPAARPIEERGFAPGGGRSGGGGASGGF
jgi:uncharacterized membrane protein YgcG